MPFRNDFGKTIFDRKYRNDEAGCDTWEHLSEILVQNVCKDLRTDMRDMLIGDIASMKFIPAGRYLYYAGRLKRFFNNCFAFRAEDTREGWADLAQKHFLALMCGGGCGTVYSDVRPKGSPISKTGGVASGTLSLMNAMNEIGRNVMQGGSRRSALWAGLRWNHADISEFLDAKKYTEFQKKCKEEYFDFPLPLDMTNMTVIYDRNWYQDIKEGSRQAHAVLLRNVIRACKDGEPGFQFSISDTNELRNA